MVILTLVSTLAAGMIWQQWRAVQVEAAERTRAQATWILTGVLDIGRVILRLDARTPGVDHLTEPWATELREDSLSNLLAQDRNNNVEGAPEAFLKGGIRDAQSRYNLRNLVGADKNDRRGRGGGPDATVRVGGARARDGRDHRYGPAVGLARRTLQQAVRPTTPPWFRIRSSNSAGSA